MSPPFTSRFTGAFNWSMRIHKLPFVLINRDR